MKKIIYALLTVTAAISFASCQEDFKENGQDSPVIDSNTVAFKLENGSIQTRSDVASPVISRQIIPMGDPVDGVNFFLEETVTLMDDVYYEGPETKGTPVYTDNFSTMFGGKFYGAAYSASGNTISSSPVLADGAFVDNGSGLWERRFTSDPYEGNDVLYFFLRGLESVEGLENLTYSVYNNGRTQIEFDYAPPFIASEQQDIVFAARSVSKSEASSSIPILFHHMLTGIKFAIANVNDDDVQTYISQVEFPNYLHKSAHFTYKSSWENSSWVDDPDTHSSAGTVSLKSQQQLGATESYKLLSTPADITPVTYSATGSFTNKGDYPDSFAAAGNANNLNDADASMTFWLVPQRVNQQAQMLVTFHVVSAGKDSGPITRSIDIGTLLANVNWKAGELRTYTLKGELLDVDIQDVVSGFEKTDVEITNTGNVDSFIRAYITANWFGNAGGEYSVAIGYNAETGDNFVPAWKLNGTAGDNFGGVFEGLLGANWVQGSDGFFYYTKPVGAGKKVPDALFTKYSISESKIPQVWYIDTREVRHPYTDVELVMEIPVQAIEAKEGQTYDSAWGAITNVTF